jgi:hypothetical protein
MSGEDQAAVGELTALAKGHGRALRVAALGTRQHGAHMESSLDSLAHRLLQAAITDAAVEPLSRDDRERLQRIDAFAELPHEEGWRVLTEREPRLAELEADADAGRFGGRDVMALPEEQRQEVAGEELQGMKRLNERLKPLVGPDAAPPTRSSQRIRHLKSLVRTCIVLAGNRIPTPRSNRWKSPLRH